MRLHRPSTSKIKHSQCKSISKNVPNSSTNFPYNEHHVLHKKKTYKSLPLSCSLKLTDSCFASKEDADLNLGIFLFRSMCQFGSGYPFKPKCSPPPPKDCNTDCISGLCGSRNFRHFAHRVTVFTANSERKCWSRLALESMGAKQYFRCHSLNIALI